MLTDNPPGDQLESAWGPGKGAFWRVGPRPRSPSGQGGGQTEDVWLHVEVRPMLAW